MTSLAASIASPGETWRWSARGTWWVIVTWWHGDKITWSNGDMVAWWSGDMVAWWYDDKYTWWNGDMVKWWSGDMVACWYGVMVTWLHEYMVTWWHGDIVTWWHGDMVKRWHDNMVTWCHHEMVTGWLGDMKTWGHVSYGDMVSDGVMGTWWWWQRNVTLWQAYIVTWMVTLGHSSIMKWWNFDMVTWLLDDMGTLGSPTPPTCFPSSFLLLLPIPPFPCLLLFSICSFLLFSLPPSHFLDKTMPSSSKAGR